MYESYTDLRPSCTDLTLLLGSVCRINNVCVISTQRLLHRIQHSEVQTLDTYDFAQSLHDGVVARLLSGETSQLLYLIVIFIQR